MDLAESNGGDFHVVLSYGDIYRQSGYRTRVLSELEAYDRRTAPRSALIVFDRDWRKLSGGDFRPSQIHAHSRFGVLNYYTDLRSLSRQGVVKLVHAHNLYSGALAISARRVFGYKVILDLHGRVPEEYAQKTKRTAFAYRLLNGLESYVVQSSDHIVVVSSKLKEYLLSSYQISPQAITVIPMCADPLLFKWDPGLRARTRAELGLQDRFVCVHLGSFFAWYDPEWIIDAFERVRRHETSAHLLVITEEAVKASDYLRTRLPAQVFTARRAAHKEVPRFLLASDLGFLLLRPTANIRVSSPTKFAEYLNAGLPVLIAPNIGDFSSMTEEYRLGTVVGEDGGFDASIVDEIANSRESFAQHVSDIGKRLTWDAWRVAWRGIVEGLT